VCRHVGNLLWVLSRVPEVVRRYFESDAKDVERFVGLVGVEAIVVDEGETYRGAAEIRSWQAGPAVRYT
jgi:hypothetical protein